jgi:hypothetical protein
MYIIEAYIPAGCLLKLVKNHVLLNHGSPAGSHPGWYYYNLVGGVKKAT